MDMMSDEGTIVILTPTRKFRETSDETHVIMEQDLTDETTIIDVAYKLKSRLLLELESLHSS